MNVFAASLRKNTQPYAYKQGVICGSKRHSAPNIPQNGVVLRHDASFCEPQ